MKLKAWHVPVRLATGAYILNSGIGKRTVDEARAAGLRVQAGLAVPALGGMEPRRFVQMLSTGEIALGGALLAPFVPSWMAGAALAAFSGGLLRMYWKNPDLHEPGSPRPTPQGTAIAKDVWMFGIALALLIDAATNRRT